MTQWGRLALIPVAGFLIAYQVRFALATIEARSTLLFVPFEVKPGTDIIVAADHLVRREGVRVGDQLIAVNGRRYMGLSVYRQELRAAQTDFDAYSRLPRRWPPDKAQEVFNGRTFKVTLRTGDEPARTFEVYPPNCTCGTLSMNYVDWFIVLPPLVCLLAGVVGVVLRPGMQAWLFLVLAAALAQVEIFPGTFSDWSQLADPVEWRDKFHLPGLFYKAFIDHSWPAWLLLFGISAFARKPSVWVWTAVSPTLAVAALKGIEAVGLAEDFRAVSGLHWFLDATSTEALVLQAACALLVTWGLGWIRAGIAVLLAAAVSAYFYWPPSYQEYRQWAFAAGTVWPLVPAPNLPTFEMVTTFFFVSLFVGVVVARRSPSGSRWRSLSLVPLALSFLSAFNLGGIAVVGNFLPRAGPHLLLASLYGGLAAGLWWVLEKPQPSADVP